MEMSMAPDRPKSTPPYLFAVQKENEYPDLPYNKENPLFVSDNGSLGGGPNIANYLIFDTKRARNLSHDALIFDDLHKTRGVANGDVKLSKSAQKYATTRIPNRSQRPRSYEGGVVNGDLRHSRSLGRRAGPVYVRASQKHSSRRHFTRGVGADGVFNGGNILRISNSADQKEGSFSFFDIESDRAESYQYRPGEEVTGVIKIIVRKPVDIRYVELEALGQGHMSLRRSDEGQPLQTSQETFLYKQKYVIGSGDAAWSTVLTPGHYTSKFRVKLPASLPSTTHHEDKRNGLNVDINYTLRARICDDVVHNPLHPAHQGLVKVLLRKKVVFKVQRAFDLSLIPDAATPVYHSEQLYLSCAQPRPAVVSLTLDRAVCLAGDDLRMTLTSELPPSHRVKDITCDFQERVTFDPKHDPVTFTLSRVIRKDPSQRVKKDRHRTSSGDRHQNNISHNHLQEHAGWDSNTFEVNLPTQTSLISPHSLGTSQMKIDYSLNVQLRISPAGGKLTFNIPIELGPCAEPIYAEKISSRKAVPLFNRPTRFSCFSFQSTPTPTLSRPPSVQSVRSALVKTKYTNNCFARCFMCCLSPSTDD